MPAPEAVQDPKPATPPEGGKAPTEGAETPEQEIARLRRENKEKDQAISNLATEKGTLEKRIEESGKAKEVASEEESSDKQIESEVQSALSESQIDPEAAGKKLASLITRLRKDDRKNFAQDALDQVNRQVAFNQEFNAHIDSIRKAKPKLVPFEKRIARDAASLMQSGVPWKKALDTAVSDFEKEFQPLIDKGVETPPETPKGSQGEGSGGSQAPSEGRQAQPNRFEEAADESPEAYVAMRKAAFSKQRGA